MMPESRSIALQLAQRFVEYKDRIDDVAAQVRRHKRILDLCPVPMFLTDEHGKCVYVNPAKLKLVGGTLDEMQYDGWQHFVYPEDLPHLLNAWTQFVQDHNQHTFSYTYRYQRPDGSALAVVTEARMLDDHSIVGFVLPLKCSGCFDFFTVHG